MQQRFQLFLDAAALLLSKATFIGLRLLTLYLCAAQVDRTVFGPIALAFTTAEMCRYLGDWGTDTWSLRQFAHPDAAGARACFEGVTRLRVASTAVAGALAWLAIAWLAPSLGAVEHGLIALTAATSLWMNLGVNWLQARGVLRQTTPLLLGLGGVAAVALLVLANGHAPPVRLLLVQTGAELLLVAGIVGLAWRHGRTAARAWALNLPQWLRETTPIALAALLALGYGRLDQYVVSRIAGPAVLGDYTLAQRLVEPLLFVAAALSSTLYARASAVMHAQGRGSETRRYAWRWVRQVGMTALGLAVVGAGVLSWGAPHWLPQYTGLLPFLWLAFACTAFRCTNLALTAFIQASGEFGSMFRISIVNAVVITVAVLSLGNILGPLGAALGVCLGEALNTCIQCLTLHRLLSSEHNA